MRQKSTSKVWNLENVDLNLGGPRSGAGLGPRQFGQEDQIMPMLFDPFEQLREFQGALDAFRSSGWLGSGLSSGGAYPPLNVFRKGDDIVAIVEVPGVRKSDLDIKIERAADFWEQECRVRRQSGDAPPRAPCGTVRPRCDAADRYRCRQYQGGIPRW